MNKIKQICNILSSIQMNAKDKSELAKLLEDLAIDKIFTNHGTITKDTSIPYELSTKTEFTGEFSFGEEVFQITFPETVKFSTSTSIDYQPNHTYQYSILNGKGLIVEFEN